MVDQLPYMEKGCSLTALCKEHWPCDLGHCKRDIDSSSLQFAYDQVADAIMRVPL